jgi:hypothetical protein
MQASMFDHNEATTWIRLPKPKARCPISGLSRSTLNELIGTGKIRAKRLRKRGAIRSIVLIDASSLRQFIHGLEDAT